MRETIKTNVIAYIASYAGITQPNVMDNYILKNHPLNLDDVKLGYLAIALRAYLKSMKPQETILASDLRKRDVDVKKTYEMILNKVGL